MYQKSNANREYDFSSAASPPLFSRICPHARLLLLKAACPRRGRARFAWAASLLLSPQACPGRGQASLASSRPRLGSGQDSFGPWPSFTCLAGAVTVDSLVQLQSVEPAGRGRNTGTDSGQASLTLPGPRSGFALAKISLARLQSEGLVRQGQCRPYPN